MCSLLVSGYSPQVDETGFHRQWKSFRLVQGLMQPYTNTGHNTLGLAATVRRCVQRMNYQRLSSIESDENEERGISSYLGQWVGFGGLSSSLGFS